MTRELIVLGTASQVPTRQRHHNGYLLRWDDEGILFDPGESAQRQLQLAGASASDITRICITHFHGDHCLGLPGIIQRMSLDGVTRPTPIHFPASGSEYLHRLRHASVFYDQVSLVEHGLTADGEIGAAQAARIAAQAGVRKLVLTHFSQRHPDAAVFGEEAAQHFAGEIVIAKELDRIPLPPRV